MKKQHIAKSPPYFLYLIIVSLLFYDCYITNAYKEAMDKFKYKQEIYYVKAGDTLWDIAEEHISGEDNILEWLSKVKALNNMERSELDAGDEIIILVENTLKEGEK